jgi:hypothetical protein
MIGEDLDCECCTLKMVTTHAKSFDDGEALSRALGTSLDGR